MSADAEPPPLPQSPAPAPSPDAAVPAAGGAVVPVAGARAAAPDVAVPMPVPVPAAPHTQPAAVLGFRGGRTQVQPRLVSARRAPPEPAPIAVAGGDVRTSIRSVPLPVLEGVFACLDGPALARTEAVCIGLRDAVRASRAAWPAALKSDLGLDVAAPAAARSLYRVKVQAYRRGVTSAAAEAAAHEEAARLRGPRRAIACALRVWHYMVTLGCLGPLAFAFVYTLATKLDGRGGHSWYGVMGCGAGPPLAILLDGVLMGAALLARARGARSGGGSVMLFVSCEGPWAFLAEHSGRRRAAAGALLAAALACCAAWMFSLAARASGDVAVSWAVACVPLWVLFGLAAAWPVVRPDASLRFAVTTGLAVWAAPTAVLLPAAAAVAARADGADYSLTVALTSVWILLAGVAIAGLAFMGMACADLWRRAATRARGWRLLGMSGIVLVGFAVLALVLVSPILVVAKLEGVYGGSFALALTPVMLLLGGAALTTAGAGFVFSLDTTDLEPAVAAA